MTRITQRRLAPLIDSEGKISERFQLLGLPSLIVIGRKGAVRSYFTGTQSEDSLRSEISLALSELPSTQK